MAENKELRTNMTEALLKNMKSKVLFTALEALLQALFWRLFSHPFL